MIRCKLFLPDDFRTQEAARCAAIEAWRADHPDVDTAQGWPPELSALNDSFFPPGSMWFCPWYHDPADPEDLAKVDPMIQKMTGHETRHPRHAEGYSWHLSIHYWRDWARVRPPIEVVCPGGSHWCPDQISNNGPGWTVTGTAPEIVCSPSIWVSQGAGPPREYHGFLGQQGAPPGWFSGPV